MAKFLLVENDPLVIRIIRHLFNPEGVDTLTVVNSREQLKSELQQDEPVAAALADIHLPDALNGEATKDLLTAGIATVILTGSEDTSARDQWLREGAVDYINKEGRYWYPYATRLLKQLQLNQKRKILIVEDSLVEMERNKDDFETFIIEISAKRAFQITKTLTKVVIISHNDFYWCSVKGGLLS